MTAGPSPADLFTSFISRVYNISCDEQKKSANAKVQEFSQLRREGKGWAGHPWRPWLNWDLTNNLNHR